LLAIDLYNLVFLGGPKPVREVVKDFPSSCGIYAWDAIKPIQELFSLGRAKGIPVIYTTTETRKEVRPATVHATNRRVREISKSDCEIYEAFKPEPGDLIIYKERASGFFGTPLVAHLARMRDADGVADGHLERAHADELGAQRRDALDRHRTFEWTPERRREVRAHA